MFYTHAKFWTENGTVWHSLSRRYPGAGTTDLCMSALRPSEVEKTIAWAKAQRLEIEDARKGV